MKLTIFPSGKGDCLLLTGGDGKRMLIDGGIKASFVEHVAPVLSKLGPSSGDKKRNARIDVVYVSHIDEDHIAGVLELLDQLVAWKIYDHKRANGDARYPEPDSPRPPGVAGIWHNGFDGQVRENAGEIEELLAATATVLSGHPDQAFQMVAAEHQNLATSQKQALLLQRRIGAKQLGIALNRPARGRLMMVRKGKRPFAVGGMQVYVLGPSRRYLDELRKEWNDWLEKNKKELAKIRRKARDLEEELGASEVSSFIGLRVAEARALGNVGDVTAPNLASLMILVEEGRKSLLLTGDGFSDHALEGLRHHGKLDRGGLHVNVLKIPHHGASANLTVEFARTVTANHYIFCGNGEHGNPELEVVEAIIDSRLGPKSKKSANRKVDAPFQLWFSCSSRFPRLQPENVEHMRSLERLVERRAARSRGRMRSHFLKDRPLSVVP